MPQIFEGEIAPVKSEPEERRKKTKKLLKILRDSEDAA